MQGNFSVFRPVIVSRERSGVRNGIGLRHGGGLYSNLFLVISYVTRHHVDHGKACLL